MEEKIYHKLVSQRGETSNVTNRSLQDLAKSLSSIITTDELLEVANFSEAIASIDGNINHYTAEQVKKVKPIEKPIGSPIDKNVEKPQTQTQTQGNEPPEWAKAMIDQTKTLTETVAQLQGEKITSSRSEQLSNVLQNAPDFYKSQIEASFNNMTFADDTAFEAFLGITKTNFETFEQKAKETGASFTTPNPDIVKDEGEKLNPLMQKAFDARDGEK